VRKARAAQRGAARSARRGAAEAVRSAAASPSAHPSSSPGLFSPQHNHTDVTDTMFSVKNNAVQDSFTDPRGNKGLDLHDYQQHRDYVVIGTQCREQPERGSIQDRIPDLRRVTYNKTDTFNGQSVYGTVFPSRARLSDPHSPPRSRPLLTSVE